jgi:hypothetical protein
MAHNYADMTWYNHLLVELHPQQSAQIVGVFPNLPCLMERILEIRHYPG